MSPSEHCKNRKRRNPERDDEFLALKLSSHYQAIASEVLPPTEYIFFPLTAAADQPPKMQTILPPPKTNSKHRNNKSGNSSKKARQRKSETVPILFPWATDRRATVRDLNYLTERQIFTITGKVQCKKCEREEEICFDLKSKFAQVEDFIANNKSTMHDRAPSVWMNPILPPCRYCKEENCVKPVLAEKKRSINWLFLLLGQTLGCCTLEQLKYFCKHTNNHRTGAKDRVLYLTYLGLCKQLVPKNLFDR